MLGGTIAAGLNDVWHNVEGANNINLWSVPISPDANSVFYRLAYP